MKMSTEQEEQEAAKAAETDASAMDELMKQTLDVKPPEEPATEPAAEEAQPEKREEEVKPSAEQPAKEPEQKPEPAEAKAEEKAPEADEFEQELQSAKYDLPAGSTKKANEINKILRQQAHERHKLYRTTSSEKEALAKENTDLKAQIEAAAKDRQELDRLRPIVETFAIERDPRVNAHFNNEMAKIDHRIMTNLVNNGLSKETADYIMGHGGPSHFSKDTVSQVEAESEYQGGKPVQMSHKQFWEERVAKQLSGEGADSLQLAKADELRLKEWRDAELQAKLSNREQYFKNLEAESARNEEAFKAECRKEMEAQRAALGDLAKPKTVQANATPEQKQRIESFNGLLKEAEAKFDSSFLDTSPKALIRKNFGALLLDAMPKLLEMAYAERDEWKGKYEAVDKKWNASLKAANTSNRVSVQQQPTKPLSGIEQERNDGRRMEMMMENLPG